MKTTKKIQEIEVEITKVDIENYVDTLSVSEKLQLMDRTFKSIPATSLSDIERFFGTLFKGNEIFSAFLKK